MRIGLNLIEGHSFCQQHKHFDFPLFRGYRSHLLPHATIQLVEDRHATETQMKRSSVVAFE